MPQTDFVCLLVLSPGGPSSIPWESALWWAWVLFDCWPCPALWTPSMGRATPKGQHRLPLAQPCCPYSAVLACPRAGFLCPAPAKEHGFWCLRGVTSGPRSNGFGAFPLSPAFKRRSYVLHRYQLGSVVMLMEAVDKPGRKINREDREEGGL